MQGSLPLLNSGYLVSNSYMAGNAVVELVYKLDEKSTASI